MGDSYGEKVVGSASFVDDRKGQDAHKMRWWNELSLSAAEAYKLGIYQSFPTSSFLCFCTRGYSENQAKTNYDTMQMSITSDENKNSPPQYNHTEKAPPSVSAFGFLLLGSLFFMPHNFSRISFLLLAHEAILLVSG